MQATLAIQQWTRIFHDTINGVMIQFGRDSAGIVYELLEPLGTDSPVYGALSQNRNLLNHVAYRVSDLEESATTMRKSGCFPVGPARAAIAYNNNKIQFFITPLKTIIELIETVGHEHVFYTDDLWQDV